MPRARCAGWRLALVASLCLLGGAGAGHAAPGRDDGARTVRCLQEAALRQARLSPGPWRGMAVRLRLAALLPRVGLSLGRGLQQVQRVDPIAGPEPVTVSGGDNQSLLVSARWDLGRLLFSPEEVHVQVESQRAAERGMALAQQVARLYYERQALRGARGARHGLRIAELTAQLEAMTGFAGLAADTCAGCAEVQEGPDSPDRAEESTEPERPRAPPGSKQRPAPPEDEP